MALKSYFADMHIHIGRDIYNKPVKITASDRLTLTNILKEASRNKGIELLGIIDCHTPVVQEEIQQLLADGDAIELQEGGIGFENATLLLGSEIEIYDDTCQGPIHVLCYLPTLEAMQHFTQWLASRMSNITLSSQRYYGSAQALQHKVRELSGLFIPAHIFTPFKSLYGKGVKQSLEEILDPDLIDAVELGLSADTSMADGIKELHAYTFLSNSDAHSLAKIAREYQTIAMERPSFLEFYWALHNVDGRQVTANYGMNPRLGKYHTTVCRNCEAVLSDQTWLCPSCGSKSIVKGVAERIAELSHPLPGSMQRPPYIYQVPLEYLPSLGPKTFEQLLSHFKTEMNVIHSTSIEELRQVVSEQLAQLIVDMRHGKLHVKAGGGGKYGSIDSTDHSF